MDRTLSDQSEATRVDVAAGLAVLVSGVCNQARIFTFSEGVVEVPAFASLALVNTIHKSQDHRNTYLGKAVTELNALGYDRLIVLTDEQSHDVVPPPVARGYMINVAAESPGVGYGPWTRVSGWSEHILDFIHEEEEA